MVGGYTARAGQNFGSLRNNAMRPANPMMSRTPMPANPMANMTSMPASPMMTANMMQPVAMGVDSGDIMLAGAEEKKSRKWIVVLVAVMIAIILAVVGVVVGMNMGEKTSQSESADERDPAVAELYEFIETKDDQVVWFLNLVKQVYSGGLSGESFKGDEEGYDKTIKSLNDSIVVLEEIETRLKDGKAVEGTIGYVNLGETYNGLEGALERDLPKFKQFVEFMDEIFEGYKNGEDIAGLDGLSGEEVAKVFEEKIPNLQFSGEGSVLRYWNALKRGTRSEIEAEETERVEDAEGAETEEANED